MNRLRTVVIILFVALILVTGLVIVDSQSHLQHNDKPKNTPISNMTSSPVAYQHQFTHSSACSRKVFQAAKHHHISNKRRNQVNNSLCYRTTTISKPRHTKMHSRSHASSDQTYVESWDAQFCGLSCHLWHATMKVQVFYNYNNVWGSGTIGAYTAYVDCNDYGGMVVDFAVQQCGWNRDSATVNDSPTYIQANEQISMKTTLFWMSRTEHLADWIKAWPRSGLMTRGRA